MASKTDSSFRESQVIDRTSLNPHVTEDPQPLPKLPPEIMVEILSRLPVKSLLQLRCVCKSWCSLISSPEFAKSHLSLASANADDSSCRIILSSSYTRPDLKSCSLYSILKDKFDSAVRVDIPLKSPYIPLTIWGTCDGLVCIGTERELCVWNPSTGKCKRLPDLETPYISRSRFGFGYDEGIDDYKVVGFFFKGFGSSFNPDEVKVCTLKSDSWRTIQGCTHPFSRDAYGVFVNRALHWIKYWRGYGASTDSIISLDLVKETYGEIVVPEYRHGYYYNFSLEVLNGCLCLLCNYYNDCFDVWMMKEYGNRDSWTKVVAIPYVLHPLSNPHSAELCIWENGEVSREHTASLYSAPLCLLENGEVLLDIGTLFIRYNPKDGTFNYPVVHNCSPNFTAHRYIESLVSPDFHADSGVKWQYQY